MNTGPKLIPALITTRKHFSSSQDKDTCSVMHAVRCCTGEKQVEQHKLHSSLTTAPWLLLWHPRGVGVFRITNSRSSGERCKHGAPAEPLRDGQFLEALQIRRCNTCLESCTQLFANSSSQRRSWISNWGNQHVYTGGQKAFLGFNNIENVCQCFMNRRRGGERGRSMFHSKTWFCSTDAPNERD